MRKRAILILFLIIGFIIGASLSYFIVTRRMRQDNILQSEPSNISSKVVWKKQGLFELYQKRYSFDNLPQWAQAEIILKEKRHFKEMSSLFERVVADIEQVDLALSPAFIDNLYITKQYKNFIKKPFIPEYSFTNFPFFGNKNAKHQILFITDFLSSEAIDFYTGLHKKQLPSNIIIIEVPFTNNDLSEFLGGVYLCAFDLNLLTETREVLYSLKKDVLMDIEPIKYVKKLLNNSMGDNFELIKKCMLNKEYKTILKNTYLSLIDRDILQVPSFIIDGEDFTFLASDSLSFIDTVDKQ